MKRNMGGFDRVIRLSVAFVIAVLYFSGVISGILAIVLGVVAIIFALTSFISFCPAYTLFGFNTCRNN